MTRLTRMLTTLWVLSLPLSSAWADNKTGFYVSLAPTLTSPTQNPTKLDLVKVIDTNLTEPTISGQNAKFKMKVGLGINGEVGYKWRSNVRTGLEVGYRKTDLDQVQSAAGNALADGEIETTTVFFNLAYDFDNEEGPAPYIFGGLGGGYHELNLRSIGNTTIGQSSDDFTFAYQAGFGFYKPLNDFIDAGLGYRFVWSNDQGFGFASTEMGIHHLELTFRLY